MFPSSSSEGADSAHPHPVLSSLTLRLYSTSLAPLTSQNLEEMKSLHSQIGEIICTLPPKPTPTSRMIRPATNHNTPHNKAKVQTETPRRAHTQKNPANTPNLSTCHWCKKELSPTTFPGPLGFSLCQECGPIYGNVLSTRYSTPPFPRRPPPT